MGKNKPTKMTIYVDKDIHTQVKVMAAMTDRSISDITEEALVEYLERHSQKEDK